MKIKNIRWASCFLVLFIVASLFSGCSATPNSPAQEVSYPQRPAMWTVTDPDSGNSIYLFGSIHAAEENLYPMDEEILDAFNACDSLAVEVDTLPYMEDPAKAMEMSAYMVYMDGTTITDEISEELFLKIQELMEAEGMDLGVPAEMTGLFRPYTFISLLSNIAVEKAGLSADHGVDMYFLRLAREQEMEILEVETMASQLNMFNSFSTEVLTYLLEEALLVEEAGEVTRDLYEAWKTGDLEALTAMAGETSDELSEEERQAMEEYNQALLTDRNAWMTDVAEDYLREGNNTFYVVGALHMVGDDGIVQQLTDRGYTVERI